MRNKSLPLILFALCATALAQEPSKPETPPPQTQKPAAETPPAKDIKKESAEEKEETPGASAPKRFIPSQRTPADNSASFPVDI